MIKASPGCLAGPAASLTVRTANTPLGSRAVWVSSVVPILRDVQVQRFSRSRRSNVCCFEDLGAVVIVLLF
jgi:hypothetical protein